MELMSCRTLLLISTILLTLVVSNSNAQLISESYYDYQEKKHHGIRTLIEASDSLKIFGEGNGWERLISFKIDTVQKYRGKVLYFFRNDAGAYLIGEHLFHQRAFLIRANTKYHNKKLIIVYYQIYDQT